MTIHDVYLDGKAALYRVAIINKTTGHVTKTDTPVTKTEAFGFFRANLPPMYRKGDGITLGSFGFHCLNEAMAHLKCLLTS